MAKKKRGHEEHENHERWLVSYADFITLLFAFFTVLYATSQKDMEKAKEFEQSVRAAMGLGPGLGGGIGKFSDTGDKVLPPIIPKFAQGGPEEVKQAVENLIEKMVTKEEAEAAGIEFRHDAMGVYVSLAASSLFAEGSDLINASAVKTLDKVARVLKLTDKKLIVEGHTDDQAIATKQFPSNWDLSSARATRIVRYLIKRHGIEQKRLAVMAYADQKPVTSNKTPEGRGRNRRIEILILTSETTL